ncbi:MAG: CDP-diacylglycerol--glycerol-3-phosphate 3-phosphatidyltransferase [Clostridia bacterium]|nr:CDP-diacylglycerol--glycerol-3-phosphate 3-phosphatidyltransferase [Clostridia bacterium]
MNTPNKLTVARIIATPFFMAAMLLAYKFNWLYIVALVLFIGASLTDMIDGKMARKYNLVTDFGKFLDPLADKMLTTAAYLGFISMYGTNPTYRWQVTAIAFIVLFREFMVSSIRLVVVSSGGKVIAANIWGKSKTVSQMIGIILALAAYAAMYVCDCLAKYQNIFDIVIMVFFWISAVLCVISGVIYLNGSKQYINSSK